MIYYINYLKDILGNNYLGIDIPNDTINPFLSKLKNIIGNDTLYDEYIKNKIERDDNHYHITVINVMDYNKLSKTTGMGEFINSLETVFKYEIDDIKMLGIGTGERGGNRTYFIVVESERLEEVRNKYNLPKFDFHITIGFKWKDVFGIKKDRSSLIDVKPIFLKLIGNLFYNNNEKWEFVKQIKGFDGDLYGEIIPLELNDTQFTFRVGGTCMHIGCVGDDDQLMVVCKYDADKSRQMLPTTEVAKILKK
jgi:hypothetical protein